MFTEERLITPVKILLPRLGNMCVLVKWHLNKPYLM